MAIIAAVANQNSNNNNNNDNNNNNNNDNDNVFTVNVMNIGRSLDGGDVELLREVLLDCGRKSICSMRKRRSSLDAGRWRFGHLAYIVSRRVSSEFKIPLHKAFCSQTRSGPNRVAADMGGNGGFDFLVIYQGFRRIFEGFLGLLWALFRTNMA